VVGLLFAAAMSSASPATAQETGLDPDGGAICVLDSGSIDVEPGSSGQGIEIGGLIWRVSYRAQRVTALDPDSLEPVIDKELGQTTAAVLTPLSDVGGLVAVSISGPGQGAVQFLESETGNTAATVGLSIAPATRPDAFQLVTRVVTIGDLAYVASGEHLTVIDMDALGALGDERAVVERIPLDHPIAELGVVDETIVLRELMSDRVWSLGLSALEPYDGPVPWSSVQVGTDRFAIIAGTLVRLGEPGVDAIDIPVIGRPTSIAATAASLWAASRTDDAWFVSLVDPATSAVTATLNVDGPIWWLWATSDTLFVETPDQALALTASRCRP
jgi:hypothetical protein